LIEWYIEYKKAIISNGVHAITFYKQGDKFITYKKFVELSNHINCPQYNLNKYTHVGYKTNIDDYYSVITLFTSQKTTSLPLNNEKKIEINNFYLNTENGFEYVNPLIFNDNITLSLYYTISDNKTNFPAYVQNWTKKKIVENAVDAYMHSFKHSLINSSNPSLYAKNIFSSLYFSKFLDNENKVFIVSTNYIYNHYYSNIYIQYLTKTNEEHSDNFCLNSQIGNKGNIVKHCTEIIDWL